MYGLRYAGRSLLVDDIDRGGKLFSTDLQTQTHPHPHTDTRNRFTTCI